MVKSPDGDKDGQTYAMMYYLLDEKNRQHINYIGMQSSDSSLLCNDGYFVQIVPNKFPNYYWPTCIWAYPPNPPPSKSEEILIFPAQMNVYGGGSSPQISYKYDVATDTWKKHYNIYDHLGTLQQTYKEEGSGIIPTSMQTHLAFGGERWTNKNLTETESTLLNWIGKEKDHESKLGDHGVRKYEYETGRFISIDPLWAKYYGWSPYQYSMNSPVMLVDEGGEKIQALNQAARDAIVGSVESRFEQFVRFDDDGMLDAAYLKNNLPSNLDVNSNAATLARIAENPALATVSVQSEFEYKDEAGIKSKSVFWDGKDNYDRNTPYSYSAGITLPGDRNGLDKTGAYSTKEGVTQIFLSPAPTSVTGSNIEKRAAHEILFHWRFLLLNKKNGHDKNGNVPKEMQPWLDKYEKQSND